MTMREKIARAIEEAIVAQHDMGGPYVGLPREGLLLVDGDIEIAPIADAVLDAVMEPTEYMVGAVVREAGEKERDWLTRLYTEMITAAKEEK